MNLKNKIEQILKKENAEFSFIPHVENNPIVAGRKLGALVIKAKEVVSTIIYRTDKGLIAAQRRTDTLIDEKKLKKIAGVTLLEFAKETDLATLGTVKGGVALVGLDIPYFTDSKVLELEKIYGGAGSLEIALTLNPHDMVKANKAIVGDFSEFTKAKQLMQTGSRRFLSGITPSGDGSLHIGNYLGAVRQFIELAKTNETYLMVADLHGLTTVQNKAQLQHNIETLVLNELALLRGFMTEKEFSNIVFFRQSDVAYHTELQSILNNVTPLGLLKRAHAYKDKLQKDVMEDDINVGLFSYPMLMAADILLYKPDLVPVGKDQKQHIEITRDIAERFNKIYAKKVLKLPEAYIPDEVASVLGTDGQRKMSKSLGNVISLFESDEIIHKQVMGTYTDPTRTHATDPGHIEGNMVFAYLDFFIDTTELKKKYQEGKVGDVEVKELLFKTLMEYFGPARKAYEELKNNSDLVQDILTNGRDKALAVAAKTVKEVHEAIGLNTRYTAKPSKTISIDEFAKMEVKVGKVVDARNKEGSDKLIRLEVDIAEDTPRIVFTGVRPFGFTPEYFSGKQFFFITNLAFRKMLDEESQGMILAVDGLDGKPQFISAEGMTIGAKIH